MRSHIYVPATYLKHFSDNPSKGRKSVLRVFNKKRQMVQNLTVDKIGIKKGAFSKEVEEFHSTFENNYNEFVNLLSTSYIKNINKEKVKDGLMTLFDFILRNKKNYENLQRIYKNFPDLVKIYGEDSWHASEVITKIFFKLIQSRSYPLSFRRFTDEVFKTSDNPIIIYRRDFGTVYLLPIDRKRIICLGYYQGENYLKYMEYFINNFNVIPKDINKIIKHQAETFYQI